MRDTFEFVQALFAARARRNAARDRAELHGEVVAALKSPEVIDRLRTLNADPGGMPPDEFALFVKSERERYDQVIKKAGIKLE